MRGRGFRAQSGSITRLTELVVYFYFYASAIGAAHPAIADATTRAAAPVLTAEEQLYEFAPVAIQIVNLASFDPVMAARLVPDDWVDFLAEGALAVESEVASPPGSARPTPSTWPIGPWQSPERLAETIDRVDSTAIASLYKALRPRLRSRCRTRGISHEQCEKAIRTSVRTLSAATIQDRALGGKPSQPITPTQEQVAGLGRPVVFALRAKLIGLHRAIWGAAETE